jgi:hypothetical protein
MSASPKSIVERHLNTGNAIAIYVHITKHMGNRVSMWIEAFTLRQKADPRKPEIVDLELLLGRQFPFNPNKTPIARKPAGEISFIKMRQHRTQFTRSFLWVPNPLWISISCPHRNIGREQHAAPVHNISPRAIGFRLSMNERQILHAGERKASKTQSDDAEQRQEPGSCKHNPPAAFPPSQHHARLSIWVRRKHLRILI